MVQEKALVSNNLLTNASEPKQYGGPFGSREDGFVDEDGNPIPATRKRDVWYDEEEEEEEEEY